MKKVLCVLCLLALSFFGLYAQNNIYACKYFSIEYPESWKADVSGNLNSTSPTTLAKASLMLMPRRGLLQTADGLIMISVDLNEWPGNEEIINDLKIVLSNAYSNVSFITEPTPVKYKTLTGLKYECAITMWGTKMRMVGYILHKPNSNCSYNLQLGSQNNKSDSFLPKAKQILDTIKFQ